MAIYRTITLDASNLVKTKHLGTGAASGSTFLAGDQTYKTIVGGNAWDSIVQVAGSDFTTTGQTLVDITGLLCGLLANSKYEFEAMLFVGTSAVTTGCKYGVQFSASGAAAYVVYSGAVSSTTGAITSTNALNTACATAFLTTSGMLGMVIVKGFIVTGANAGNVTMQTMKVTSGTSTVKVGSMLKVRKIA